MAVHIGLLEGVSKDVLDEDVLEGALEGLLTYVSFYVRMAVHIGFLLSKRGRQGQRFGRRLGSGRRSNTTDIFRKDRGGSGGGGGRVDPVGTTHSRERITSNVLFFTVHQWIFFVGGGCLEGW